CLSGAWILDVGAFSGTQLNPRRIRLRQLPCFPFGGRLQRLDRSALVKMNYRVKLLREIAKEVMTRALGLRTIDNANGAFQRFRWDQFLDLRRPPECQEEAG